MILENLQQDVRLAWRGLWRAKAFSGAAVLTLGLGIAGTTVMFTLIQGALRGRRARPIDPARRGAIADCRLRARRVLPDAPGHSCGCRGHASELIRA